MRPVLVAAVIAVALATEVPGAAQAPAPQAGPKVKITFEPNGLVTLIANEATPREILAEWTRLGGSVFVNGERLPGTGPLTLNFTSTPEKEVLASLLRPAAGYMLGPRRAGTIGASSFEVVYILPTSNPSASGYVPSPSVPYQPQVTTPGFPDDEIPPAGRGAPPPPPGQPPAPGPQPAPEYRPATSAGSGVAVPVIAIPPAGSTGPPTTPPPSTTTGTSGS